MGKSYERDGLFGKYIEHFDDEGNKIGESRERDGLFGKYTEHTDSDGNKTGESRNQDGFFGKYTEHTDSDGNKTGESRNQDGLIGKYTEHTDVDGNKTGESRDRDGLFGKYTEHTGFGSHGTHPSKNSRPDSNFNVENASEYNTSSFVSGQSSDYNSGSHDGNMITSVIDHYSKKSGNNAIIILAMIFLVMFGLLVFLIHSKRQGSQIDKINYYTQTMTLNPGRMYQISWDDFSARPYEVEVQGKKYKTFNYFIDRGEYGSVHGSVFEATIEYPWKVRVNKKIEIRIGFTHTTNYYLKDVTGKFKNNQMNIDGNLYDRFKNYR